MVCTIYIIQLHKACKHKQIAWHGISSLIKTGLPIKFWIVAYCLLLAFSWCCLLVLKRGNFVVIMLLVRKKFHAKQICVLTGFLKLGPGGCSIKATYMSVENFRYEIIFSVVTELYLNYQHRWTFTITCTCNVIVPWVKIIMPTTVFVEFNWIIVAWLNPCYNAVHKDLFTQYVLSLWNSPGEGTGTLFYSKDTPGTL